MNKGAVANRYANAIFELGKEQNMLESLEKELQIVKEVFTEDENLNKLLNHPKISKQEKKNIVKEVLPAVSETVYNTLYLLIDRHRQNLVPELVEAFIKLSEEERGTAKAVLVSAKELSQEEINEVNKVTAEIVGKQSLEIETVIDPSVIGGVKLKIGNRIFDGTIKSKLERIERELISNK
jgi:F-type H+-transporting ATPase subunit delta